MADDIRDDIIEANIKALWMEISSMIKGPSVLQRLYGIIPSDQVNDTKRLYRRSDSKATFRMMECLLECRSPGKWQAFMEALQQAGYPYLADLLKGHKADDCSKHAKRILQVFGPYLELQINPDCVVDSLRAGNVIDDADLQEIKACLNQQGSKAATAVLLNRLQCHLSPKDWYFEFLRVLYKKGYKLLVNEMEPDFMLDCEVLKCPVVQEQLERQTQDVYVQADGTKCLEEQIKNNAYAMKEEIAEKIELENIMPYIMSLLPNEMNSEILETCKDSQREGVGRLLEEIRRVEDSYKWRMFVEALQKAEYHDIADKLKLETAPVSTPKTEQWIIAIFNGILQTQIDPDAISADLVAEGVINEHDRQCIAEMRRDYGCQKSAGLLIQQMQCRQPAQQWYTVFLKTLMKHNYEDLARRIDPDFYEKFTLQNNPTPAEVNSSCHDEGSDTMRETREKIMQIQESINHQVDGVKQQLEEQLDTVRQKTFDDIELKRGLLLGPICKAKRLFEQYKLRGTPLPQTLKDAIEKDIEKCKGLTVSCVPLFDINNVSKFMHIKINEENATDSTDQAGTKRYCDHRVRKESNESFSSGTSGYIEVCGSKSSPEQSPKMDIFSESDGESDPLSESLSRGSSSTYQTKVTFREDYNFNPAYLVRYNMSKRLRQHCRNSSYEQKRGILKTGRSRERTKSESCVTDKKDTLSSMIKDRSMSLERISWKNKSEFQQTDNADKTYHDKYAESKSIRKRKISESNSVCSEVSLFPPSTRSSQEFTTDFSSPSLVSNTLSQDSSQSNRVLVLHEKHSVHSGNYVVTDVCSVDSDDLALINSKDGSIVLYDMSVKHFRTIFTSGKVYKAYKMVWFSNDNVYILLKTCGFATKLNVYRVCRYRKPRGKRSVTGLRLLKNVQFGCANGISDIKRSGELVVATCFNKDVHFIKNHEEIRCLHLDVCFKSWWPHSIAVHESIKYIYVFDLYSQKLFCFDTDNGIMQWDWLFPEDEGIEGMATDEKTLYLAQNRKERIAIMNVGNHEPPVCMTIWSQDVRHPFALYSGNTKLLVTQFHQNWERVNRTLKCF